MFEKTTTPALATVPFDKAYRAYKFAQDMAQATHAQFLAQQGLPLDDSKMFELGAQAGSKAMLEYFKATGLNQYFQDLMPEIMQYLVSQPDHDDMWKETESGLIDGYMAMLDIFGEDPSDWSQGLYYFLMQDNRSAWLPSQYRGTAREFCSLVPLIPYAFKLLRGVPYQDWDRNTISYVVNPRLAAAMVTRLPKLTSDQIIDYKTTALQYISGSQKGLQASELTANKLPNAQKTPWKDLPELAAVMQTQIWCAHPESRTLYMVLDPHNWDRIPPMLQRTLGDLPWDM